MLKQTIAATLLMCGVAQAQVTTAKDLLKYCMSPEDSQFYSHGLGYVVGAMEMNRVATALGGQVKMCAPAMSRQERYVRVCKFLYGLKDDVDLSKITAASAIGIEYACDKRTMDNLSEYEQSRER